jgi:hypothetical protein
LIVQFQMHPIDRVIAPLRLRVPDEVAAELRPGGLRRLAHRLADLVVADDAIDPARAFQQVVQASGPVDVVVRQVEQRDLR